MGYGAFRDEVYVKGLKIVVQKFTTLEIVLRTVIYSDVIFG